MGKFTVGGVTWPRCGIGTPSPARVTETLRVGDDAVRRLRDGDLSHLAHVSEVYRSS